MPRVPIMPARLFVLPLLALGLAACSGTIPPTPPGIDTPAHLATVTLTLPAPTAFAAQYLNAARTTRVDVQVDASAPTSYTLGSTQAPCSAGLCTITLGALSPQSHTFTVGSYGVDPATSTTVLISQGSVTQTLSAGQNTALSVTLAPVNTAMTLSSAVKQYNSVSKSYGNYVKFATSGGRSLPAYYDLVTVDSVGDPMPGIVPLNAVLCGDNSSVVITDISDATHPNRFRVEVQAVGTRTLSVQSGSTCGSGGTALATQVVRGVSTGDTTVKAGSSHGLVLLTDGTVRAWGYNFEGQLGNSTTVDSSIPVTVSGLNGVVGISGGADHSLALRADGTVKAWGKNTSGQLGNGTTGNSSVPVNVSGLHDAVSVSGGYAYSVALLADGTVRAWGSNSLGELGDGTTTGSSVPVGVSGLSGVVSVSSGGAHSVALLADGTVKAWGYNEFGQLGNGTTTDSSVPVNVSGLSGVVSVSGGGADSMALLADGSVKAWGRNNNGQLGDGTTTDSSVPVNVSGLSGVVSVSGGGAHSVALLADGGVKAWGGNFLYQLGNGTYANSSVPVTVSSVSGASSVSAGGLHSLALLKDGTVRAWGYNAYGQLGDGTTTTDSVPVSVVGAGGIGTLSGVMLPTP